MQIPFDSAPDLASSATAAPCTAPQGTAQDSERPLCPDCIASGPPSMADALRRCAVSTGALDADIGGFRIGRVELAEVAGERLTVATEGCAAAPRVAVLLQLAGCTRVVQGDRSADLTPGDLCLLRSGRPMRMESEGTLRLLLVGAPEDELADRFPLWRAALLAVIRGDSGVPAVFWDAIASLRQWRSSLEGVGSDGLADAVVDLMGALVCFAAPSNGECIRQSLLQKERVKKAILANLRNPDLTVESIATSVGLSPRQVHRLFADEGVSLMRWVWTQRLEQCHRDLVREDTANRSIADVAYAWGFNDQAHFSRAFRKRYGLSPRDARRRQIGERAHGGSENHL